MDAKGGWSSELAYAALGAITSEPIGQSYLHTTCSHDLVLRTEWTVPHYSSSSAVVSPIPMLCAGPLKDALGDTDPCVFVIEYCDGFRAFLLGMGSYSVPRNIDDGQICESLCTGHLDSRTRKHASKHMQLLSEIT